METVYVGIDVHQQAHKAAIIPQSVMEKDGKAWKRTKLLTIHNNASDYNTLYQAIQEKAGDLAQVSIAIDHTGGHYSAALVHFLTQKGYQLWFLEAKALKDARNRFLDVEDKSDELDAKGMARILYARDILGDELRISAVSPQLGSLSATMRSLALHHWALNKLTTRATNRLHQLLTSTFPEGEQAHFETLANHILPYYPTPASILQHGLGPEFRIPSRIKANILRLAGETVGIPAETLADTIQTIALQRNDNIAKKERLEMAIHDLVQSHPYGYILTSFPGIGDIAAAILIGVIGDINRWRSKKHLRKGLGVYPTIAKSGKKAGQSVMGREGSSEARRALFQAVFSCITPRAPDNAFRTYYQRKVARGMKRKRALVATMGKMAEIIYHCLNQGEAYVHTNSTNSA